MADDFSKLDAAVAANTAATAANTTAVQALVALATKGAPSNQPAIDAATSALETSTTALEASNTAIDAVLNPATPLAVSPTSLTVTVGAAVTDQLTVTGGTAPYSFSASNGLSIDSAGAVTGSVATAGESTIEVTDSAGASVTVTVTAA